MVEVVDAALKVEHPAQVALAVVGMLEQTHHKHLQVLAAQLIQVAAVAVADILLLLTATVAVVGAALAS